MTALVTLSANLNTKKFEIKEKEVQVTDIRNEKYYVGKLIFPMSDLQVQENVIDNDENITIQTFCLVEDKEATIKSLDLAIRARLIQKSRALNKLFRILKGEEQIKINDNSDIQS